MGSEPKELANIDIEPALETIRAAHAKFRQWVASVEIASSGLGDAGDKHPADGLTREYLADWYGVFWHNAKKIIAMIDGCPLTKDMPYKTGYSSRLIEGLIEKLTATEQRVRELEQQLAECQAYWTDRNNKNRERAETAERQLATERERNKSALAELERIARGEHPRYWTLEKGDVLFRSTGEVRTVNDGEWFQAGTGSLVLCKYGPTIDKCPIYRRIDAPADAKGGEQPADTIVEIDGKRYRREAVARLPKAGELYLDDSCALGVIPAHFDFEMDPQHILHEITDEPSPSAPTGEAGELLGDPRRHEHTALPSEGRVTIAIETGTMGHVLFSDHMLIEEAKSLVEWVSRRAETEAQLAQLKQQAEADKCEIERLRGRAANMLATASLGTKVFINRRAVTHLVELYANETRVYFGNGSVDVSEPILALAAQLESTQKEGAK